jgi:DNA-binding NarL/FixJ family response regulator
LPTLLIVDDHEVVREGLSTALERHAFCRVIGAVGTGSAALALASLHRPSLALVDLRLPDMSGDELCKQLIARCPDIVVVMLSTYLYEQAVRASLLAGASAYVTKSAGISEVITALRRAARGTPASTPDEASQIVGQLHNLISHRTKEAPVTPQQESVLVLAAQGLTYAEIGRQLYISESTVRFHIQKLKPKFNARSKTDLVAKAIRAGVINATAPVQPH